MLRYPFKVTDQELIDIYYKTKSLRETALIAQGTSSIKTVRNKLESLGVEICNYRLKPITVSDDELIELYNSGLSLLEIAKKVSGSKGAMMVRKRLQELGVDTKYSSNIEKYKEKMSASFHTYNLNEHVFDVINNEEKAYWFGFLMADGYNNESKTAITVRLQSEDFTHLEKLKRFFESDAPIYEFRYLTKVSHVLKTYYELRVNSVHLSKQLAYLGCIQGKSYTIEFPNCVPNELMNHFIRGFFDGDGCVSISKRGGKRQPNSLNYQLTIVGRENFLSKVEEIFTKETSVNKIKLTKANGKIVKTLHYGGYNKVMQILNYLYKDATIYLERKHNIYEQLVTRQSNLQ